MENHSETQSLQMSGNNSSSVSEKKQSFPFLWHCCLLDTYCNHDDYDIHSFPVNNHRYYG